MEKEQLMIEGLWTGEWDSTVLGQSGEGAGIFIFRDGKVYGGSARYYFFGEYAAGGDGQVSITLQISHYSGPPSGLLGPVEEGQISLSGTLSVDEMLLKTAEQDAAFSLAAKLVKRTGPTDA